MKSQAATLCSLIEQNAQAQDAVPKSKTSFSLRVKQPVPVGAAQSLFSIIIISARWRNCLILHVVGTDTSTAAESLQIGEENVLHDESFPSGLAKLSQNRCFAAPVFFRNKSNAPASESKVSSVIENDDRSEIQATCPVSPYLSRSKSEQCDPTSPGSMETPLQHGGHCSREIKKDSNDFSESFSPDKRKRKVQRPLHELCNSDQISCGLVKKGRVQLDPAALETEDCNVVIEEVK